MLGGAHQVLGELDGSSQVVGPGPLLADVDLVVGRDHLALQSHTVEMEHAHSAVAVLVQATHELDRHSLPDVHLEWVILPAELEVSR
ncbi:MAG: hypothetical protein ACK559_37275, partial [bacterium]